MFSWSFLSVSFLFSFSHERLPICKPESDKKQPKPFRTPIHLEKQLLQALLLKKKKTSIQNWLAIIDISGWQLPSEIDYDVLSQNVGGVIVRVHSGAQAKKENAATYLNGLDKSFKTHIQEFQKRNIPVAVYAYVAAKDKKEMEKEAEEFYKAASPYKPTYYWLDVEEKTMKDMNAGVEAFRAKLQALGAKNIGLYIGTYFMEEHSISTDKFTALWIPTYGFDDGYYNAAPDTNTEYDLHQYTSQGQLNGFSHYLDLNQIAPTQDQEAIYRKLFKVQKDNSSS